MTSSRAQWQLMFLHPTIVFFKVTVACLSLSVCSETHQHHFCLCVLNYTSRDVHKESWEKQPQWHVINCNCHCATYISYCRLLFIRPWIQFSSFELNYCVDALSVHGEVLTEITKNMKTCVWVVDTFQSDCLQNLKKSDSKYKLTTQRYIKIGGGISALGIQYVPLPGSRQEREKMKLQNCDWPRLRGWAII